MVPPQLERAAKKEDKSTRQMVYVTISTDKMFLSREACADLKSSHRNSLPWTRSAPTTHYHFSATTGMPVP
jgi:hypothetical protein